MRSQNTPFEANFCWFQTGGWFGNCRGADFIQLYLGSNLSKKRETEEDIQARIGKAR